MTSGSAVDKLSVGGTVAGAEYHIDRDTLVKYAGVSGDFNPIHYRDDRARDVGLPGVLAHGMLTMGMAIAPVVEWLGDPSRILDYEVRFSKPVFVDAIHGAVVSVVARVGELDAELRTARIDLVVTVADQTVLAKARARVNLA